MHATSGDQLIVRRTTGKPDRHGEVLEARGDSGGPPFLVRWEDTSPRRCTSLARIARSYARSRSGVDRADWADDDQAQPINLTEEQHEFRRVVRQFCEDKIAPLAAETDAKAEFPWAAFHAMKAMGLTSLSFPEAYGGRGALLVTQAIVVEEIARVCASTSLIFLISKLGMLPVMNFGTEELKQQYLPRVAARGVAGVVLPVRARRRLRRRGDEDACGARR